MSDGNSISREKSHYFAGLFGTWLCEEHEPLILSVATETQGITCARLLPTDKLSTDADKRPKPGNDVYVYTYLTSRSESNAYRRRRLLSN